MDVCLGLQQCISVSIPLRLFSSGQLGLRLGLGLRLELRLCLTLRLAHRQDLDFLSQIRGF